MPDYEAPLEESAGGDGRGGARGQGAVSGDVQLRGVAALPGALDLPRSRDIKPPHISQPMYNLLARGIEQEYLPFCKEFGVSTVVYNPLAGGLLTGKQKRERPLPGTRFDNNQMYLDRYWHPAYFDASTSCTEDRGPGGTVDHRLRAQLAAVPHGHRLRDSGASKIEQLDADARRLRGGPAGQEAHVGGSTRSGRIFAASRRSTTAENPKFKQRVVLSPPFCLRPDFLRLAAARRRSEPRPLGSVTLLRMPPSNTPPQCE